MWELDAMLDYYDREPADASSYALVDYTLRNLGRLGSLTLGDVARETYVSKATVSRFVRSFGHADYAGFTSSATEFALGSTSVGYRLPRHDLKALEGDPQGFFDSYVDEVCAALQDMRGCVSLAEVDELIGLLSTCEAAVLAVDQPLLLAREIQLDFLRLGRVLHVGETAAKRAEIAAGLSEGDFALVLSNYGGYVNDNLAQIEELHARGVTLWLVTLCHSSPNTLLFDHVLRLSSAPYSNVGIHPMKVLVEYLVRRALARSGS